MDVDYNKAGGLIGLNRLEDFYHVSSLLRDQERQKLKHALNGMPSHTISEFPQNSLLKLQSPSFR